MQHTASRLFFLREEKDRREPNIKHSNRNRKTDVNRTQNTSIEPLDRREPNAKRRDQRALRTSDKALKEKRSRRSLSPAAGIRRTYIKPPIPESCTLPRRVTALFRAIRGATGGAEKIGIFLKKGIDKTRGIVYYISCRRDDAREGNGNRMLRTWEHSSVGRASALQAEGHRFEPCCSHSQMWPGSTVG